MNPLASILRVACTVSLVAAFVGGCGGNSFTSHPEGDSGTANEGGSSSVAGTHSSGGKTAHGGSRSTAGDGQGGSMGGAIGGSGVAGGASAGSGGVDYYACKLPTDCTLIGSSCCGVCDSSRVTSHDFIAVNKANAAKVTPCAAGDVACGACPPPDAQGTRKYLVPNCVQGECVVEDLRESDVTACKTAADCRIHWGNGCCPNCTPNQEIAVRNDGSFEDLVCGAVRPPCNTCAPQSDAVAVCGANQHCAVAFAVAE